MSDIKDLVSIISIDNIDYQVLSNALYQKELKGRKGDKYTRITFETDEERMNDDKEALILWVDKEHWSKAVNEVLRHE